MLDKIVYAGTTNASFRQGSQVGRRLHGAGVWKKREIAAPRAAADIIATLLYLLMPSSSPEPFFGSGRHHQKECMHPGITIENIEELRRREGVEDVELGRQIRDLAAGDLVNLTFLSGTRTFPGEVLSVRITSIKGDLFRGKLVGKPASAGLAELHPGAVVTFTAANIHSVARPG
jgi:hypothetical protein